MNGTEPEFQELSAETHVVFLAVIFIFGIIGNMFVICIYSRQHTFRSFNLYIISLAMCDLLVCLTLPAQMPLLVWYKKQHFNGVSIYLKAFNLAKWLAAFVNGSHLLMIAIDRTTAVFQSTVYKQSKKDVLLKIIIIFILCILVSCVLLIIQISFRDGVPKKIFEVLIAIAGAVFLSIFTVCYAAILYKIITTERRIYPFEIKYVKNHIRTDIHVIRIYSTESHKSRVDKR